MATVDIGNWSEKNTASIGNLSDGTSFTGLNKVQPIIITWGNSSPGTGTGDCEFSDSVTVDNNLDLVVTESDESTTRPYEVQQIDTTNNVAVVWVYGNWNSDGSDQVVVGAGGDGDGTDYSSGGAGNNPWGSTGINAIFVHHLQESGSGEGSNDSIYKDSTANGYDGDDEVSATGQGGQFADGQEFDGSDDFIDLGDIAETDGISSLTVANYAKHDASGSNEAYVGKNEGGNPSSTSSWAIRKTNTEDIRVDLYDSNGDVVSINGSTSISTSTWYHTAFIFDGSNLDLYIDGNADGATSASITIQDTTTNVNIGRRTSNTNHMNGEIDAVRVFSDAKTSTWMQADFDSSPKKGQVFFSWGGATTVTSVTEKSVTGTFDAAIKSLDSSLTATVDTATTHRQNGNVQLDGSNVQGAEVHVYNVTQQVNIGHDQTDSNGDYSIDPSNVTDIVSGDKLMIATYYEDGNGNDFGEIKVTVV